MDALITIFTPTYNRAYTLPKLYHSLCRQSRKDFKWLVVDDGSTDDTEAVINGWQKDNFIEIIYFKQENQGKMCAHNLGVQKCDTELFFCVDSDDFIVDDAVDTIISEWTKSPKCSKMCGLVAYKAIGHDGVYKIPSYFPFTGYSTLSYLYKNGFKGDTSLVFRTEVLKVFPFPVIHGERFITEAYVYNQIDKKYELLLVDKALTMCEYMPDGYTSNEMILRLKYPMGWYLFTLQELEDEKDPRRKKLLEAHAFSYFLMYKSKPYADKKYKCQKIRFTSKVYGFLLYVRRRIIYHKEIESLK